MSVSAELEASRLLRNLGRRATRPRIAVLSVLLESPGQHLSVEEILTHVVSVEPMAHRATVYRTLESLTDDGVVRHVHLDRGVAVYHLTGTAGSDGSTPDGAEKAAGHPVEHRHHHDHLHAQCRRCGVVIDLPSDSLGDAARRVLALTGFHLDAAHVALSGVCGACADGEPGRAESSG